MKGGGYYDANSSLQARLIQSAVPLFNNAVDSVSLPDGDEAFTIVDYGCGEGKNSLACIDMLINRIRQRNCDLDINVIQNDLWINDFNRLFSSLYSEYPDPRSYSGTSGSASTYFFASGRSFYDQIAANGSVHIGLSTSAVHWLGTIPDRSISKHIHLSGATALERRQLAHIAAEQWHAFLQHRSREIVPGGKLIVVMLGCGAEPALVNDSGLWTGETFTGENLMDLMFSVLTGLVAECHISADKLEKFAVPLYCRTTAEALLPLTDPASALAGTFKVDHLRVQVDPSPLFETYQRAGDSRAYATALIDWTRAWIEPLLTAGLFDPEETSATTWQQILEELYDRMSERIAISPEAYACNPIMLYLSLTRA